MTFSKYIILFFLTIPVFFLIDIFWIGFVADKMYWKYLGHLRSESTNWIAAILFYTIFISGIIFFAVKPAIENSSMKTALLYGALFGFFTYATYDLTNHATLKDWPWIITIADIAWGVFLCGSVSSVSYWIASRYM